MNIPKCAIELLRQAADEASNNSCNDYYVDDTRENRKFIIDMMKYFEEEDFDIDDNLGEDDQIYTTDWMVLDYIAHLVEEANTPKPKKKYSKVGLPGGSFR